MDNVQKRIEQKHLLNTLSFTEENFELLKEQVIDSIYPESISEKLEKQMHRNAQELQMKEARAMAEQYKFAMPKKKIEKS